MKKLRKLRFFQNAEVLNEKEMKMIKGGAGSNTGKCDAQSHKCDKDDCVVSGGYLGYCGFHSLPNSSKVCACIQK